MSPDTKSAAFETFPSLQGFNRIDVDRVLQALRMEMTALSTLSVRPNDRPNVLFLAGAAPDEAARTSLLTLSATSGHLVVHCELDPAQPLRGEFVFRLLLQLPRGDAAELHGGRLWKRNRRSASSLVFPAFRTQLDLSPAGHHALGFERTNHNPHGFARAAKALLARAAGITHGDCLVTEIGTTPVGIDEISAQQAFGLPAFRAAVPAVSNDR